jgi:hypothetical protein
MKRVYLVRGAVDNVDFSALPPDMVQEFDIQKDEPPKADLRPVIITAIATILAAFLVSRRK